MIEFGERLKQARESKGMTQQSLADKLFVTRQTISRWECGERYPDVETIKKISSILEVSADNLFADEDEKQVIEKSPVIERSWKNNVLLSMYAAIMVIFVIQAITYIDGSLRSGAGSFEFDTWYNVVMLVKNIFEIVLFALGFSWAVFENLIPKRIGIIVSGYFLLEGITYLLGIVFISQSAVKVITLSFIFIPYIIGAIMSYLFFLKGKNNSGVKAVLYLAIAFAVGHQIFSVIEIGKYAAIFMNITYWLSVALKIMILLSFVYEVLVLSKRRESVTQ